MRYSLIAIAVAAACWPAAPSGRTTCAPRCRCRTNFRAPEPLPPPAGRFARRPEVVRGLQGRATAGADPHGARAELRSARRGGARRRGPRKSRHHALEPISASRRRAAISKSRACRATARCRCPRRLSPTQNRNWGQASLNLLSFEVDLWGRLRRATEAARANLLSAEENRKAVVTTLVSDVAGRLFQASATGLRTGDFAAIRSKRAGSR